LTAAWTNMGLDPRWLSICLG